MLASGCGRWTAGFILFNAAALHMSPGMVNVIRSLPAWRKLLLSGHVATITGDWTYLAEVVWSHWPRFVWVLLWAIDSLGKFLSRCYPFVEELLGGKESCGGYTHSKDLNTVNCNKWTFIVRQRNNQIPELIRVLLLTWLWVSCRFACQVAMASSSGGSISSLGVCFAMLSNLAFCCNSDA